MRPKLNWFGWSTETIAAVYETNQAAVELAEDLVNEQYLMAAFNAERIEDEKDKEIANAATYKK